MNPQPNRADQEAIDSYLDALKVKEPASPDEVQNMLRSAIGDRGLMIYLIWKVLQEKHPQIDATKVLKEACFRFGETQGKIMGEVRTPAEFLKKLSSRGGVLAWEQTLLELNDEKASKIFFHCPHMASAQAAGATKEELVHLCREIMMDADFGTASPFPHLQLAFPGKTCAEGGQCLMEITQKSA